MTAVLVHKAVEPGALTRKGKKRLEEMLLSGEYILQPKLDGVYCQIVTAGGGAIPYSRTGELLYSVPEHVLEQFVGLPDGWRFIGELWKPRTPHATINGMARKQSQQAGLELHLFDSVDDAMPDSVYENRYARLTMQEWKHGVEVVENLIVPDTDMEELYALAARIKSKESAYDGLVLKDSKGLFVPGAGKDGGAIKIKPRASGDFRIVGVTAGKGMREGGIGAFVLDLGCGVTCEVGTGLTQAMVFADPKRYIGQIAEVEFLSLTRDRLLREPALKSIRFDKVHSDTVACAGHEAA